jgi:hypothetical protein
VYSTFSEWTPIGAWPGPAAAGSWRNRQAGYTDSSGRGVYDSSKTVSEHDGLLDVWIHSEGDTRFVAAPIPLLGDTVGQRISLCMRTDVIPGYKVAFLLWPSEGNGNDRGEIDFPEGKLDGGGSPHAFMHYDPKPPSGKAQDAYNSGVSFHDWHTYTVEWHPGGGYTAFYLDGWLLGKSTQFVPRGPMHYVMQIETYLGGDPLPPPAEGHVYVDWVTISTPY